MSGIQLSRPIQVVLLFMVALAFLGYLGGIVWTGIANLLDTVPEVPEWITYMVTGVGGALATHFGATLGISQAVAVQDQRQAAAQQSQTQAAAVQAQTQAAAQAEKTGKSEPQDLDPPQETGGQKSPGRLQLAAIWFYLGSLLVAAIFWAIDGVSSESAELLRSMTFTLAGLVIGAVSVALNVRQA